MKPSIRITLISLLVVIILSFVVTGSINTAFAGGLAAPTLVAPANSASLNTDDQPITLDWTRVIGATKYKVQVYKNTISTGTRIVNVTISAHQLAPATTFEP